MEVWINHIGAKYIASTTESPIPGCNKCGQVQPYYHCWVWWSAEGDHILCNNCYKTVDELQVEYIQVRKTTRIQAQLNGP